MALTRKVHDLAAWPVVSDADYGLRNGRSLCQGTGWYCWSHGRTWCGTAQTGPQPVAEYARSLASWLALQRSATEPFMVMTDSSRIRVSETDVMTVTNSLVATMQGIVDTMSPLLARWAVVAPGDWSSNFFSGVIASHARQLHLTLFTTRAEAWDHLEAPPEVRTAVDDLDAAMMRDAGTTSSVEAALRAKPNQTLAEVARALSLSPRSLQRLLTNQGETFAAARNRVRLRLAEEHLAGSMQIKAVANAIGFNSASHFVSWYRGLTGTTPGGRKA